MKVGGGSTMVVGTCEDMCPANERRKRQEDGEVHHLELPLLGQSLQQTMIKKFQRSSADHALQIAEELRTPAALLRTIQYVEDHIMNDEDDPLRTYLFIWDRYRMIAKDFTLQASVLSATRTFIECHERMVRWFVFMDHAMQVNAEFVVGHAQQNSERLNDILKSLGHYYESQTLPDSARKNQAEFLSYFVLLQIGNGGEVTRYLFRLPSHLLESPHLTFAVYVWTSMRTKNFMRFFQLLSDANVLQASLMHRYLGDMRLSAIQSIGRACSIGSKAGRILLSDIADMLLFESREQTLTFLHHCGYSVDEDNEEAVLDGHVPLSSFPRDKSNLPIYPAVPPLVEHIGKKARQFTVQEVCRGAASIDDAVLISAEDGDAEIIDQDTFSHAFDMMAVKNTSESSVSTPISERHTAARTLDQSSVFPSPVSLFLKASPSAQSPRPKYSTPVKRSSDVGGTESEKRKALLSRQLESDRSSATNSNSSLLHSVARKQGHDVFATHGAKSNRQQEHPQYHHRESSVPQSWHARKPQPNDVAVGIANAFSPKPLTVPASTAVPSFATHPATTAGAGGSKWKTPNNTLSADAKVFMPSSVASCPPPSSSSSETNLAIAKAVVPPMRSFPSSPTAPHVAGLSTLAPRESSFSTESGKKITETHRFPHKSAAGSAGIPVRQAPPPRFPPPTTDYFQRSHP